MNRARFFRLLRRATFLLYVLGACALIIWLHGWVWYMQKMPRPLEIIPQQIDVAIVLTGGDKRVAAGLGLLQTGQVQRLFISGVHPTVRLNDLRYAGKLTESLSAEPPSDAALEEAAANAPKVPAITEDLLTCCVELGYEARNTRQNADEVEAWLANLSPAPKRIAIITASYHMPRALYLLRNLHTTYQLEPWPVFPDRFGQDRWWLWPDQLFIAFIEYNKYLLTRAQDWWAGV